MISLKTRSDFVTNSSSSSFIIKKINLDDDQLQAIRRHADLGEKLGIMYSHSDAWEIQENEECITGFTFIDNFSFEEFFTAIGVDGKFVAWDDVPFDLDWFDAHPTEEHEAAGECQNWRELLHEIE